MTPHALKKLLLKHGGLKAVARATKTPYSTVQKVYVRAVKERVIAPIPPGRKPANEIKKTIQRVKALKTVNLVRKGARYIISCVQNNTDVHVKTLENIQALAKHYDAKIMVSTFLYNKNAFGNWRLDKKRLLDGDKLPDDVWFDARVVPYIENRRVKLAPGLVFAGELNISPTAARPLSGLEVYTGRASMIAPHTQIAMQPIATVGGKGTKFNYTTGTLTLRNYIQRKEGFKAEFHHCYGGLLVEVDEKGHWWVRQLNADSDGTIYDWDLRVKDGVITTGHRLAAITFGDIHVDVIDEEVADATWGEGGVVDQTKPREQHVHDVIDFYRRGHHNIKNFLKMFKRFVEKKESIEEECEKVVEFLEWIKRPDCETYVIASNHHEHLERWLVEQNGLKDPVNAEFWTDLVQAALAYIRKHGKEPILLEEAIRLVGGAPATFLDRNTSHVICRDSGGGIECSQHGDKGANGAKGTLAGFAKLGRRSNTDHDHSGGIVGGAYRAGTKSKLSLEYNSGLSSWNHSDIFTYENGKRAIITFYAGKARA